MGAAFLAIAIAAGVAVIGRLAGPADAVPVAFFGMWAALLIWILDRVPAGDTGDTGFTEDAGDTEDAGELHPEPAPEPDVRLTI